MKDAGIAQEPELKSYRDPLHVLRHEHETLLGQLVLLEGLAAQGESLAHVLKTLIRDSGVHFKREGILLQALNGKLGISHNLEPLREEHGALRRQAMCLFRKVHKMEMGREACELLHDEVPLFAKRFRDHIRHEEQVVYVLARSRLSCEEQQHIACRMLVE